ncbi:MAG TPA: alanine racemase [Candidatus Latescibacteria bacterium]|nr:alanine racemase [Candidatus Handelsmanbacteria bacterium]HIL07913.1 alanine racemase [Candidatus Latescibacterota bacterium]
MEALPEVISWCEVSAEAIRANLTTLRRGLSQGTELGIVVKSNAYGHGLAACAGVFIAAGADWLIVNSVGEAIALRGLVRESPIYICGPVFPDEAPEIAGARASVAIYDSEMALALANAGQRSGQSLGVHIKVETGTNRQGVAPAEALELALCVDRLEGVRLEGITTHYADIEDTTDHRFALSQLNRLQEVVQAFADAGLPQAILHSANSAATLISPVTHGDLVRVGIAAYGLWPSNETYATALERRLGADDAQLPDLQPVLSWRARVAQVKDVAEGEYIGYGRTYRATYPMRIAVLPVGYYEGYDRRLSNIGHALINGVRAPVRGRICMNMAMVDISHIPHVERGTVATLLGRDGNEEVSAAQWGGWMGSIHYEAIARIHPGQPRYLRLADGTLTTEESYGR